MPLLARMRKVSNAKKKDLIKMEGKRKETVCVWRRGDSFGIEESNGPFKMLQLKKRV